MIRIIKFLFTGDFHIHKRVNIEKIQVFSPISKETPVNYEYICKCEICGKIKSFKV